MSLIAVGNGSAPNQEGTPREHDGEVQLSAAISHPLMMQEGGSSGSNFPTPSPSGGLLEKTLRKENIHLQRQLESLQRQLDAEIKRAGYNAGFGITAESGKIFKHANEDSAALTKSLYEIGLRDAQEAYDIEDHQNIYRAAKPPDETIVDNWFQVDAINLQVDNDVYKNKIDYIIIIM